MRALAFLDAVDPCIRAIAEARLPEGWRIAFTRSNEAAERAAAAAEAEAALIIGTGIDAALLAAAPRLRFVQKLGAGLDRIDREACARRGVAVARLQGGNAAQVAEHTVLLMLAALRRLPYFDLRTRQGAWLKEEGRGTQRQLAGKCVGLVGLGAIGRAVAARLAGFEVSVLYHDPFPADAETEARLGLHRCGLDDLLARADVVSLHAPLTPETRRLIDARRIALMKPGATLVNCARGGLIDETALLAALEAGALFSAALDTFEREPPEESPLLGRADVVVSPHLAGATVENFAAVFDRGMANVATFFAGGEPPPGELVVGAG